MTTGAAIAVGAWVLLPAAMFGGDALMRLMIRGGVLSEHKQTWFRAGHAHAGTLLLLLLLYIAFIDATSFGAGTKTIWTVVAAVGVLGVSGGLFLHMATGRPDSVSAGIRMTTISAVVLAVASLALAYGLATA
ncbi:MAG: hypothetical protein M3313_14560 [Actinomycetota bacterium]|nr:hypothetical protein [Actinomycetota bacterium]